MSIVFWFSTFFVLFTVLYYVVGMHAGKQTHTENDYFLAGRNLGFWPLTGTLLATQIGAGLIFGVVDKSYMYGLPGLFYGLGMAVGFVVLGIGIAGALRSLQVATTAEIFEKYFHSPFLKRSASLLSILSLVGIFICQVIASRKLMIGLGVESELLFLGFWTVLIGYTMYGGLPAVIATDLLQVAFIATVFLGLFGVLLWKGVITGATISALSSGYGLPSGGLFNLSFAWVGMPFLFSMVEQDLAQRFFSARSSSIATVAAWAAGIGILAFTVIPTLIGIQARLSGLMVDVAGGQSPLLVLIAQHIGPMGQALVMCAIIAAIASTADSLLCAVTSNVVQDFVPKEKGSAFRMRSAEVVTALVGLVGVVGAYYSTDVLGVMIQSYELLVSGILISVLMCVVGGPLRRLAALFSVLTGFCVYSSIWLGLMVVTLPGSLVALAASLVAYGVGLVVSSLIND